MTLFLKLFLIFFKIFMFLIFLEIWNLKIWKYLKTCSFANWWKIKLENKTKKLKNNKNV